MKIEELKNIYKYKVQDKWYYNFLDLCRSEKLSMETKSIDVINFKTKIVLTGSFVQ